MTEASTAVSLRGWIAMVGGLTGGVMALLNTQTTAFAVADIQGGIHADADGGAWIINAYSIGELAIIPVTAALAAGFTTRLWLVFNAVAFLASCAACAAAANLQQLLIFRVFEGLTGGALLPLAFKIALTLFKGPHKPLGIALFGVTATFTPTIAATTDGWVTDHFGWTGIFYQNMAPTVLCVVCALIGLPREPFDFAGLRRLDWLGAAVAAAALICCATMFYQGNRLDWFQNPMISVLALLSLAFLLLFVWHELTVPTPLVDLRLVLWPQFGLPILVNSLFRIGLLAAAFVIPGYLTTVQNLRPLEAGTALLWVGVPQLVLAPAVLALSRRIDERILMTGGLLLFAAGSLASWHLTTQWQQPQFLWGQILQGVAEPFVQVPLMVIATSLIGPQEALTANVIFNALKTLATSIGIGLVSTLLTKREQFHSARLTEAFGPMSNAFRERLAALEGLVGASGVNTKVRGIATVAAEVRTQALTMAYADSLVLIGVTLLAAIAIVWLIPSPPRGAGLRTWYAVCRRDLA